MSDTVRINLHCHSTFSDGQLSPEQLVARLAQDGVRFAALTDHHTLDGLVRFREAAAREGIGVIAGVEIFAESAQGDVHLLAYGFDLDSAELRNALATAARPEPTSAAMAVSGPHKLSVEDVLRIVHQAGGKVFLAHPHDRMHEHSRLEDLVHGLKAAGLDGLEAVYAPYDREQTRVLLDLAASCGLLVSGGSDFHGPDIPRMSALGVDMPRELWLRFRGELFAAGPRPATSSNPVGQPTSRTPTRLDWTSFFLRILLPTLAAIALLVVPVFTFVIPAFEDALLARKREMIRELTNSAASILAEYHEDEKSGRMSREEAQTAAAARVQFLRYGKEGKDYFWITDMGPRMVMHPYRTDLNGQDVSGFRDPKGNPVFMEFVRVVKEQHEGYVEYVWQWKDDPARLAPKQSYVKGFAPWGWVIGTGIYIEDVRAEIALLSGRIIRISAVLAVLIALLLLFVAQQSLRLERRRRRAEDSLRESHEKYRALVEASTEGTMLVVNGRPSYANQTMLALLGYSEAELSLLEVGDVILQGPELPQPEQWLQDATQGAETVRPAETRLRKRNGETVEVLLTVERMTLAGRPGCIVMARDLSAHKGLLAALDESQSVLRRLAESLRAAVLRTSFDRRMRVVEANPAAFALLALRRVEGGVEPALGDLFASAAAYESFRQALTETGEVRLRMERLRGVRGEVAASLSAVVLRDQQGEVSGCEIVIEEPGLRLGEASERDQSIADLQAPLLSLNEPVARFMRPLPACELGTRIEDAAVLMARHQVSALLVTGPEGEGLGLVTDSDFRSRVVGRRLPGSRPVHEVMSAPLVDIAAGVPGYLAILLMQEKNLQHVVVRDEAGRIQGVIRNKELLEIDRYPLASLSRAVSAAGRLDDVLDERAKLPALVKALVDAGAKPRNVSGAIAAVTDAVTKKLVALACEELGPAPVPFAFIALGSQGRGEQTLASDQDNALVFDVPAGAVPEAVQAYFLALGERVCGWLARAGYSLCKGGAMASSPRFCVSLPAWKELFSSWITTAEPKDLLEFNIFFDLRCVHGQAELVNQLRRHVMTELGRGPSFFVHLAQNALHQKPLLGFFGNIVAEPDDRGSAKSFSIKEAVTPIVSFARLYALRAAMTETNTFERLRRLGQSGVLSPSLYGEVALAYELLMSLRLRHQGEAVRAGLPIGNQIGIKSLTRIEEIMLKEIFAQVTALQKRIAADFLGGAWVQSG